MSAVQPPEWWVALQGAFGAWLQTPLDVRDGAFRAPLAACEPSLRAAVIDDGPGAAARLALYHEQYWSRLFQVFQGAYPRVTRALGAWRFNQQVAAFLHGRPLRSFDLADAPDGFYDVLRDHVARSQDPAAEAVTQALALDEAERRAFRAPRAAPWTPEPPERASLAQRRVRAAPGFSLVRLDWALLERDGPVTHLAAPEHVVVFRSAHGVAVQRVDAVLARLLARASREPLGVAVRAVIDALPEAARPQAPALLDTLVDRALREGWWIGADPP